MNLKYNIITILLVIVTFPCNAAICEQAKWKLEKGQAFYDNEQYSEATALYLEAMKTAKVHNDMTTYTEGLYDLGMVYVRMDDMERALYYFNSCLERAKSTGDKTMQGKCVSYMACCYGFLNDLDKAKLYYNMQSKLPHENENMKQYYLIIADLSFFWKRNTTGRYTSFTLPSTACAATTSARNTCSRYTA